MFDFGNLLIIPLFLVILSPIILIIELYIEFITKKKPIEFKYLFVKHYVYAATGLGIPFLFFLYNFSLFNKDPCGEPAILHTDKAGAFIGWYAFAFLCFSISYFTKNRRPPLIELLLPFGLLLGSIVPLIIAYHLGYQHFLIYLGSLPLSIFYFRQLWHNQQRIKKQLLQIDQSSYWLRLYIRIESEYWLKLPVLMAMAFPIVALMTAILYLFGQKPNDLLDAFSDTCGYNLSDDRYCGECMDGHYLCTIAAYGDPKLVRPLRAGYRHGKRIIVNRQLLASNAFEEWLEQGAPRLHRWLRRNYDRYGLQLAKELHQARFANFTYLLMKPLEWLFIFSLYLCTTNPETRIHRQYRS